MRVLFITNAARYGCVESIGQMYLSALLLRAGHETRFVAADLAEARGELETWKPDIIGYTASTGEHVELIELNRSLKQSHSFLAVFGGPHPTFSPEMIEEDGIDVVCVGEGEDAMVELADALEAGESITSIRNLWVKDGDGTIHRNPVRPFIDDLDTIPFPEREGFYRVYDRPRTHGIAHFLASRGCPFSCSFCFNRRYFEIYEGKGQRVRMRAQEKVVDEMEQVLGEHPYDMAMFRDDVFPWKPEWLEVFVREYRARVDRPFICNERVETLSAETCRLLKEAGCHTVLLGIESGNETLRREVLNRKMSNDDIRRACRWLREAGIRITATNIIGFPRETIETAMDTLRLNAECKVDLANATFCQPYPGTALCEIAREEGYLDETDAGWGNKFFYSGKGWRIPNKAKLERLRALFAVSVGIPALIPLLPVLIRLPLGRLYVLIEKLWSGYRWLFRVYPLRMTPGRLARLAWNYLLSS